jgi:hypothetical protein
MYPTMYPRRLFPVLMKALALLSCACGAAAAAAAAAAAEPAAAVADCSTDPASALRVAVASLRAARDGSTSSRATLTVRGLCRLAAPLELDGRDSNVQWVGEEGASISGAIEVPRRGWTKHAEAQCSGCGTVWVAQLNASATDSRQLYVDGVRANRTVMQFPQSTAKKHARGFDSPLAARFSHNHGAKIEMLHRGTHTCNYSSRCAARTHALPADTATH